jgi:hypothetical protein
MILTLLLANYCNIFFHCLGSRDCHQWITLYWYGNSYSSRSPTLRRSFPICLMSFILSPAQDDATVIVNYVSHSRAADEVVAGIAQEGKGKGIPVKAALATESGRNYLIDETVNRLAFTPSLEFRCTGPVTARHTSPRQDTPLLPSPLLHPSAAHCPWRRLPPASAFSCWQAQKEEACRVVPWARNTAGGGRALVPAVAASAVPLATGQALGRMRGGRALFWPILSRRWRQRRGCMRSGMRGGTTFMSVPCRRS